MILGPVCQKLQPFYTHRFLFQERYERIALGMLMGHSINFPNFVMGSLPKQL
jgi:hypothetical protein